MNGYLQTKWFTFIFAPIAVVGLLLICACGDEHVERGKLYLRENRLTEAAEEFQAAAENHPQAPEAYIGLAQVAVAQEEYELALVQIEKARHFAPNSPEVLNEIVGVYLKDARIDLAIKIKIGRIGGRRIQK